MVRTTLDHLARGGIRDHLGGGYHRYSTERTWTVPHFEKMLYDNALLASVFLEAYEITGDDRWKREAEAIFTFVAAELTDPDRGGFYSALDAETDGEEGAYYVWTRDEVEQILGDGPDTLLFLKTYGLNGQPNFEGGRYVLNRPETVAAQAEGVGMTPEALDARLAPLRAKLLEARDARPTPLRDDKVLTAWNGLMIAAYADGYRVLGDESYRQAAEKAAGFLWETLRNDDGQLLRTYRAGEAKLDAYLEDYAFFTLGLLRLHEATGEAKWLDRARVLADRLIADFEDEKDGGFYFTADDHESLLARPKDPYDSAIPSGNSVAVLALLELADATGEPSYRDVAGKALRNFSFALEQTPSGVPFLLVGLMDFLDDAPRAAVDPDRPDNPANLADPLGVGNPQGVLSAKAALHKNESPRPGETVRIDVTLDIADGWHVYANPAGDPAMIPTEVTLADDAPARLDSVVYPAGIPLGSPAGGGAPPALIYEVGTTIPARARLARDVKPGPLTLTLRLRYQACNDRACRPPATLDVPLRLEVQAP